MMFAQWNLPAQRTGTAASDALLARREALQGLAALQLVAPGVEVRSISIGAVECVDVGREEDRPLLYVHGGGFRMGEASLWAGLASRIALTGGVRVLIPNYRLAPEHPFPAALHDLAQVYESLICWGLAPTLVLGDSAGGGLACTLLQAARAGGVPLPRALVLLSPWLDLTLRSDTYRRCAASDRAFSTESAQQAASNYLQGAAADDPLVTPALGDFSDFPPSTVFASSSEVLLGDSLELITRMSLARRRIDAHIWPDLPHVWPIASASCAATSKTIEIIASICREHRD